jgi:hypothetical protein
MARKYLPLMAKTGTGTKIAAEESLSRRHFSDCENYASEGDSDSQSFPVPL